MNIEKKRDKYNLESTEIINKYNYISQTYTDEDHGIAQSRAHLYHSLENFLDECFQTLSWSEHGIVMTI